MILSNRNGLKNTRNMLRVFGGLNETYSCTEAEYSAGINFSARNFPALSTRLPRRKLREEADLNGMYHLNGLLTVCGRDLVYTPDDADEMEVTLKDAVENGRKTLVGIGTKITLIGANGAGKSTTLKTISGLLHPKTGDVLYKGKSIKGVRAHKIVEAGLAQVPEGRHVFLHMTVEENLDMGAYTQPASTIAPNKEKVFELFPRLKERRKQLAGTMSGGEQQMLAMGRALMSNASMLMLDEPSMGLSPLLVQEIFDIIQNIHKEGMTILLVEQNAQMALSVADRAYVLETGRVVMDGTGAELLTNERVRSAYLGG